MTNQETRQPRPDYMEWVKEYYDEFTKESDRAAVILSASMLENSLEDYLRARLVPSSSASDSLLDGPLAPLGSLSAKIEFALRLGLISDQFARDLHIIRKIRNDFAHNIAGCSFDDAATRSRVGELMRSWRHLGMPRDSLPEGPRHDYLYVTTWMLVTIRIDLEYVQPLGRAPLEDGYTPDDLVVSPSQADEAPQMLEGD